MLTIDLDSFLLLAALVFLVLDIWTNWRTARRIDALEKVFGQLLERAQKDVDPVQQGAPDDPLEFIPLSQRMRRAGFAAKARARKQQGSTGDPAPQEPDDRHSIRYARDRTIDAPQVREPKATHDDDEGRGPR